MENHKKKEDMNIVIVGHVDHGKSTIIGRLLADTDSLPKGKLEDIKERCRRNSKPFEYAFLLDALKDEQSQGITIDTARCFFKTKKRDYIILDAPGHIEFLKNMITGASRAQAALLVIDAAEGVQENSRRHGYMLSMLGIKQVAVVVNKMDLVDYEESVFKSVQEEYNVFLHQINMEPKAYIPVSGFEGENIASKSEQMPWYEGDTVLDALDHFECEKEEMDQIFRMPVQGVYKFTKDGDDRRIIAGTVETGKIQVGDEIRFFPSGKKSHVKSIEGFNTPEQTQMCAGVSTGFTMEEQIYIKRGEVMTKSSEKGLQVASRIFANIFWLGKKDFMPGKIYFLKIGFQKVRCELEKIEGIINSSNLEQLSSEGVANHEVAEVILRLEKPIAFDLVEDIAKTSRFVIVDDYEIAGGGIITKKLDDENESIREDVLLRNYKWEYSEISEEYRAEKYGQKSKFMLITGDKDSGKKKLAKALEKSFLDDGRIVYYFGIGSFLYGVDADAKKAAVLQESHIRRMAEVVNMMLDAGMIVIVTARNVTKKDVEIIETVIEKEADVIWVGKSITTDLKPDLQIENKDFEKNILLLKKR